MKVFLILGCISISSSIFALCTRLFRGENFKKFFWNSSQGNILSRNVLNENFLENHGKCPGTCRTSFLMMLHAVIRGHSNAMIFLESLNLKNNWGAASGNNPMIEILEQCVKSV